MVIIKILFVLKVILGLVAYIFIIVNLSKISSAQTTYEVVNGKLMYYQNRNAVNVSGYFALVTVIYLIYNVFIYLISLFAIMFAEMAADVHYLRQRR